MIFVGKAVRAVIGRKKLEENIGTLDPWPFGLGHRKGTKYTSHIEYYIPPVAGCNASRPCGTL
jgi:hypothetical protein